MSEQRQRFLEDFQLNYYSVTELAERFSISRTTANTHPGHRVKWIERFKQPGQSGFHEQSRRPHICPWQTGTAIVEELVKLRKAHPRWVPRKLLDTMHHRDPKRQLPAVSTAALASSRNELGAVKGTRHLWLRSAPFGYLRRGTEGPA